MNRVNRVRLDACREWLERALPGPHRRLAAKVLPPTVYGGWKDASAAWAAGVLDIEGWES